MTNPPYLTKPKSQLSAPLLIGIGGFADDEIEKLLAKLDTLLPATPIFLLECDESNCKVLNRAFPASGEPHVAPVKKARTFTVADAGGREIMEQHAAYLLKNCTFVVVTEAKGTKALRHALASYKHALPFWTPATGDVDTFGKPADASTLPYPAPVLDTGLLETLVNMMQTASVAGDRSALPEEGTWSQCWRLISGKDPAPEDVASVQLASARERSAFLSLPSQLRQLDAFNAELASLKTADRTSSPQWMGLIMEAADRFAQEHQNAWQNLVFTTTKHLASIEKSRIRIFNIVPAAVGFLARMVGRENKLASVNEEESFLPSGIAKEVATIDRAPLLDPGDEVTPDQRGRWKSLAVLGVVAATMLAVFTELASAFEDPGWQRFSGFFMMSAYVLVLGWAFCRYRRAKVREHERKHQDYRLIVECLRVQRSWMSCGIRHYVADALPAQQTSESTWVVNAIRAIRWRNSAEISMAQRDTDRTEPTEHGAAAMAHADMRAKLHIAKTVFVADQLVYHDERLIKRREEALSLLEWGSRLFLALFLFSVTGLFLNSAYHALFGHGVPELWHHFWIILTVLMVSLWAAHKKVAETFGLEAEVLRGKAVQNALARAHGTLSDCLGDHRQSEFKVNLVQQKNEEARQTLLGIGKTFAQDQAVWHALHRSRPIEVVTGT